jgi:hypothetical protein
MRKVPSLNQSLSTRFLALTALWVAGFAAVTPAQNASQALFAAHEAYTNGDFEVVLTHIEGYQKRHPRHSLADSIFIAKHLAVVHASNPQTREKGRYHMFRMLEMDPSADLVDMFISQDLDVMFEKVRKEFLVRQNRGQKALTPYAPTPHSKVDPPKAEKVDRLPPAPIAEAAPKKSGNTWIWIAGGAAVAAGAVTAYYLTLNQTSEGKNTPLDN